jgi:potassium channel subfamily K
MASAFSICALVVHWRVYIAPGAAEQNGVPIDDPKWLIAINALQLAIALISNLFLLLNMAKRVSFSIAQPITIIGW